MLQVIKKRLFPTKKVLLGKLPKVLIGWQEWCALPGLHVPAIKAKIDTGAKTSALHAFDIRPFHRQGELFVHFVIHPLQRNLKLEVHCTAKVVDQRIVKSSSGQKELRYVIAVPISMGALTWDIEITLTNRDLMTFRMLLARDALKGHAIIDPGRTLCQGKYTPKQIKKYYTDLKGSTHS
jgi:ribosomal protein S6--L-glutamate ligase